MSRKIMGLAQSKDLQKKEKKIFFPQEEKSWD